MSVGSLDGGRVASAISPHLGVLGLAGGGVLAYTQVISNPIFYLILLGGTYTTVSRAMGWSGDEEAARAYRRMDGKDQAKFLVYYMATIAALLAAMQENNRKRKSPKEIQMESPSPHSPVWDWDVDGAFVLDEDEA